jgi:hypothetical protein
MKESKQKEDFWTKEIELLEMDMADVQNVLEVVRPETAIMVWGGPGIGKTRVIESYAEKNEMDCRTIVTSTYEPTDIGGVPMPVTKDGATKYVEYLVAKWGYDATVDSGLTHPMVLFFDDLVTAHEQVQAACYRLFLDKEIGSLKLRDNIRIIGAGNRPEDNAATHDMPTPLGNRMLHIYARCNPDVWCEWAVNEGRLHPWTVAYIRTNQQKLYNFDADAAEKAFASPRSIHMLSNTLYDLEKAGRNGDKHKGFRFKLTAGLCGHGWAYEFYQWVKMAENSISPQEIVKNPNKAKLPKDLDIAHCTVASAERYLMDHPSDWKPMLIYSQRIEPELGLLLAYQVSNAVLYKVTEKERLEAAMDPLFKEMFDEMGDLMSST